MLTKTTHQWRRKASGANLKNEHKFKKKMLTGFHNKKNAKKIDQEFINIMDNLIWSCAVGSITDGDLKEGAEKLSKQKSKLIDFLSKIKIRLPVVDFHQNLIIFNRNKKLIILNQNLS